MNLKFDLYDGISTEGGDHRREVVLQEPTAGAIFAARSEAETIKGEHLVESTALFERAICNRMVVSIGGAPATPKDIDRLSNADYHLLLAKVEEIFKGGIRKVAAEDRQRGGESGK